MDLKCQTRGFKYQAMTLAYTSATRIGRLVQSEPIKEERGTTGVQR